MKSPMGGTSCQPISMRTGSPKQARRFQFLWQMHREPNGEIRFRKISNKEPRKPAGPMVMYAMVPRRVLDDKVKLPKLMGAIGGGGGEVVSARGRMIAVACDAELVDGIGEALDSFGCQWDVQA